MIAFSIFFCLVFVFVSVTVVFVFCKAIGEARKNRTAPRLTVSATVVTKRASYSRTHTSSSSFPTTTTRYYATFEVESGDRMELLVPADEYGLLVEGDFGTLTFQGTLFLRFARQ